MRRIRWEIERCWRIYVSDENGPAHTCQLWSVTGSNMHKCSMMMNCLRVLVRPAFCIRATGTLSIIVRVMNERMLA